MQKSHERNKFGFKKTDLSDISVESANNDELFKQSAYCNYSKE